jgi:hypothetical protein
MQCNASGEIVKANFQAPVTGTINNVRIYWSSGGNASSSFDCSIYEVDANGYVTGTALAQTTGVSIDGSVNGNTLVNFSTGASVTRGQRLALYLEWASGDIRFLGWLEGNRYMQGATSHYTGSWASETYSLLWEMDISGTYYTTQAVGAAFGVGEDVYETRDSADTNLHFGVKFQVPFDCKVSGMSGYWGFTNVALDNRSSGKVSIYDASNTLLGDTPNFGRFDASSQASGAAHVALFTSEISLTRNTTYRMVITPTDAVYGMTMMTLERPSASDLQSMISVPWVFTESADLTSWTDDDTKMPILSLIVSEVSAEEGGGGGSSAVVGYTGG